jgi:esterase/lipase superfamily enzyme
VLLRRRVIDLWSPAIGASGTVLAYGHWGRPVLVFPSEAGQAGDFESNGMIDAVADLLDGGRVKLYCVDSYDAQSWSDRGIPLEERARRHGSYESWIIDDVASWIFEDCGGPTGLLATGCSMGAFHAANITLKRGDLFPQALCLSGNYDPGSWHGWGERGETLYFNTPVEYVAGLHGEHLDWLRRQVHLTLVCGQGMWEDTTGAQASTRALAGLLAEKDIPHELDVWGHDVAHDWPWWQRQLAHHLHRMC